jgi:hypothetical protein
MALGRSPPRRLPRSQAHLHGTGLNHCPSGVFNANTAWLLAATLAHNLIRWTQLLFWAPREVRTVGVESASDGEDVGAVVGVALACVRGQGSGVGEQAKPSRQVLADDREGFLLR